MPAPRVRASARSVRFREECTMHRALLEEARTPGGDAHSPSDGIPPASADDAAEVGRAVGAGFAVVTRRWPSDVRPKSRNVPFERETRSGAEVKAWGSPTGCCPRCTTACPSAPTRRRAAVARATCRRGRGPTSREAVEAARPSSSSPSSGRTRARRSRRSSPRPVTRMPRPTGSADADSVEVKMPPINVHPSQRAPSKCLRQPRRSRRAEDVDGAVAERRGVLGDTLPPRRSSPPHPVP